MPVVHGFLHDRDLRLGQPIQLADYLVDQPIGLCDLRRWLLGALDRIYIPI